MKKLLTLLLAVVMLMSMAACAPEQSAGTPDDPVTITLYPLNANLQSGTVDGWLGEYLLSKGIIAGEEGEYGMFFHTVNGITLDWDKDGKYWAFYINGEYAMTGVDMTEAEDGAIYTLKPES